MRVLTDRIAGLQIVDQHPHPYSLQHLQFPSPGGGSVVSSVDAPSLRKVPRSSIAVVVATSSSVHGDDGDGMVKCTV
jgi:hypothetical protein